MYELFAQHLPWSKFAAYAFFLSFLTVTLVGGAISLKIAGAFPQSAKLSATISKSFYPWFVMAPIIVGVVLSGPLAITLGFLALSLYSIKEFGRITGIYRDIKLLALLYILVMLLYLAAFLEWWALFPALAIYSTCILLLSPTIRNNPKNALQNVGLGTFALFYFGYFLAHGAFLTQIEGGTVLLLYIIIATELNDAAAFMSGKLFGRRKLCSNISPGKTLEGALGALIATSVFAVASSKYLPYFSPPVLLITILLVWFGGIAGDLVMSYIKRDIGIKDTGTLIPGHGGLLDRVDSFIFVIPLFTHLINYFVGLAQ